MKLIPGAISRKIAQQGLLASENSPKILFVGGVLGMVSSTVLACHATLKLEEVLDQTRNNQDRAHEAKRMVEEGEVEEGTTYTDQEYKKDLVLITVQGVVGVAKLYAPSFLLGAASVAALTKSHNLLQERNLALTAAYAAVDTAFRNYRERVVERYGAEADRNLRYDIEQVEITDEEGKKIGEETIVTDTPGSVYARWYDEVSSRNWSPDPDVNMVILRNCMSVMDDKLKARGHLFLNEVFTELGLSHTKMGSVVGWRYNKGSGDDYVDFGMYDGSREANEFFNGREGAILLDFNVDPGTIHDKIEEG